jgi:hypothetical protein
MWSLRSQNAGLMRISYHLHHEPVASVAISIDDTHAQPMLTQIVDTGFQIAMGIVEERLAISHQQLQVTNLGSIERWIINFTDYAIGDREPHAT